MFRVFSKHSSKNKDLDWIPHPNIITPNLVLGGVNLVQDMSLVQQIKELYGVTHVLCCCDEVDESRRTINLSLMFNNGDDGGESSGSGVSFMKCVIEYFLVGSSSGQWEKFLACFQFLDRATNGDARSLPLFLCDEREVTMGSGVAYVHCMRGRSRSATVVISYLMYRYHLSLAEAYEYVKRRRPFIGPHQWLKRQLVALQPNIIAEIAKTNPERASQIKILSLNEFYELEKMCDWQSIHTAHMTRAMIEHGINEEELDREEVPHEQQIIQEEQAEVEGKVHKKQQQQHSQQQQQIQQSTKSSSSGSCVLL